MRPTDGPIGTKCYCTKESFNVKKNELVIIASGILLDVIGEPYCLVRSNDTQLMGGVYYSNLSLTPLIFNSKFEKMLLSTKEFLENKLTKEKNKRRIVIIHEKLKQIEEIFVHGIR